MGHRLGPDVTTVSLLIYLICLSEVSVGPITVTDLLETIIGDIEDPLDEDDPTVLE
jgi:hypothetical protein